MQQRRSRVKEPEAKPRALATTELKARTPAQSRLIHALDTQDIVFAVGPAGTGKTYCCAAFAAAALRDRRISRIVLARPAVEAGEKLGFLPGEASDKIAPYLRPYHDVFTRILGRGALESAVKHGNIEGVPFAHMQGLTFDNAIILLDEAENTTEQQMELALTRIGEGSKIFVSGDLRQTYIRDRSGLAHAPRVLASEPGMAVVEFTSADVVRSEIARRIVAAYERSYKPH